MIRMVKAEDFKGVTAVCRDDLGYDCSPELVKKRIECLDPSREAVFVSEEDNIITGFIHAEKYETLYFESMVNILGLAVKAAYRHRGIGKRLMDAAEIWAKENGIHFIRLNSGASRTEAHRFYQAIGFEAEKDQKRFIKEI